MKTETGKADTGRSSQASGSPAACRYYLSYAVIIDSWGPRDDRSIVTQETAVRLLNEAQYRIDEAARAAKSENDKMSGRAPQNTENKGDL